MFFVFLCIFLNLIHSKILHSFYFFFRISYLLAVKCSIPFIPLYKLSIGVSKSLTNFKSFPLKNNSSIKPYIITSLNFSQQLSACTTTDAYITQVCIMNKQGASLVLHCLIDVTPGMFLLFFFCYTDK